MLIYLQVVIGSLVSAEELFDSAVVNAEMLSKCNRLGGAFRRVHGNLTIDILDKLGASFF